MSFIYKKKTFLVENELNF